MDDRQVASLVGGTAITTMLLVMVWMVVSPDSGRGGDPQLLGASPTASVSQQQPSLTVSDPMRRCLGADALIEPVLQRTTVAVRWWHRHVTSTTRLVDGHPGIASSWRRSADEAHSAVSRVRRASTDLRSHHLDCPRPAELRSFRKKQLVSCAREVAADVRALAAARAVGQVWHRQLHVIRLVRDGTVSPSEAQHRWTTLRPVARHRLAHYRSASRTALAQTGCVRRTTVPAAPTSTSTPFASLLPTSLPPLVSSATPSSSSTASPSFTIAPSTSATPTTPSTSASSSPPPPPPPPPPTTSTPPPPPTSSSVPPPPPPSTSSLPPPPPSS